MWHQVEKKLSAFFILSTQSQPGYDLLWQIREQVKKTEIFYIKKTPSIQVRASEI